MQTRLMRQLNLRFSSKIRPRNLQDWFKSRMLSFKDIVKSWFGKFKFEAIIATVFFRIDTKTITSRPPNELDVNKLLTRA